MAHDKIWLSSPHMGGNEQQFVKEAFDSNWVAPLGPNVTGFEQDLEQYLGANSHVAGLSSGTAALHLGLIQLGVQAGDEVICQSMTFSASANPIAYLGAKPIFVDSEKDTWNLCPIALEEAIVDRIKLGNKPKAIVAVHLYGFPYKVTEINQVAQKYDIPVLEDSAEALGSTYHGQKCGTFGDIGILSFNGNKIITTSGGGALVAHTLEVKNHAVFLATQARDNAPHYQHSHIGYNYRLSNICAGIGRGQMEVLDRHIENRRANFSHYRKHLSDLPGISFLDEQDGIFCNRWLSAILVGENAKNITRETIRLDLEKDNIETRPLWKPMHLQPIFENAPYYGTDVAETLFRDGLCLPSGSNLTELDLNRIVSKIKSIFES
ncbi:MAG: pyridoxal phosphate-dependent aminotransferase [Flavobacterium sp. BFFFF2]|nr:MAG: pyridoxal phosphate-dependent aminotransferase [Flavobacterium sp. BFFFF2]